MRVCKLLGKNLQEGMKMSVFELKSWAAFLKLEHDYEKEAMEKARHKVGTKKR